MTKTKRQALSKAGWRVGTVAEFLKLSAAESAVVEAVRGPGAKRDLFAEIVEGFDALAKERRRKPTSGTPTSTSS